MTDEERTNLKPAVRAADASNKLLRRLAEQIIALFRDKDLPRELKILLIPLLFLVPLYSLTIVIFLGNVTVCLFRNEEMRFQYYLIFLGITALSSLGMLLVYSILAEKYVSARELDNGLQIVTNKRRARSARLEQ